MSRGLALVLGLALVGAAPEPPPGKPIARRFTGINIATGGFAPDQIPGRYGQNYVYPSAGEAAPFLAAGMNAVRVPVLWERIQPKPNAPLDDIEMARIDASLAVLKPFRLIILDVHNYGAYRGVKLDRPGRSGAMLADLWLRLASRYKGDAHIAFGLMNEPVEISAPDWRKIAEQSLRAIRATGARNLVLVPGTDWTSARNWTLGGSASNGEAMANLRDPAGNMAFEMHQYVDADSSGTSERCIDPAAAAERLKAATIWLRRAGARGFLGEFGSGPGQECLAALEAFVSVMDEGSDVWLGWTYWAGGGWWGSYPLSIQPDARGEKPQMAVLRRYLASGRTGATSR